MRAHIFTEITGDALCHVCAQPSTLDPHLSTLPPLPPAPRGRMRDADAPEAERSPQSQRPRCRGRTVPYFQYIQEP